MASYLETFQEQMINNEISALPNANNITDGYHTFGELYEHRIILWIALCKTIANIERQGFQKDTVVSCWRAILHSDHSMFDGWFLLGIGYAKNEQMTYHLPISKWSETNFAETLDKAPEFDGHTSEDVLERIKKLF
jgi:hypothetical protein